MSSTKSERAIFCIKVTIKVNRSLTLLSFERATFVKPKCQTRSLYLSWFEVENGKRNGWTGHKQYAWIRGIKHTLNDGQQDDNDKEEECDVEKDSETFRGVAVCWLNLITYSILNFNRSV